MKVFILCPDCEEQTQVEEVIDCAAVHSPILDMDEQGNLTYGECRHVAFDSAETTYQCCKCGWRLPIIGPDAFAHWITSGEHWLLKNGADAN